MTTLTVLVGAAAALVAIMAAAWALAVRTGQSGWADAFWSLGTGVVGVAAVLLTAGDTARGWLVATFLAVWALRLGLHIVARTLGGHDDPRYAALKRQWGDGWRGQLLLFLEIQAAAGWVLVAAAMAAADNPAPLGWGAVLSVAIALAAIGGEAVADAQLRAFARDPANRGKVCDVGLWSLSRHPNYFLEWLFWVALVPIGLNFAWHPWGWAALLAPALMYLLLRHVSGVPPLETHMLSSRGEAYQEYQGRVPAFWPVGSISPPSQPPPQGGR